jgi:hypothetical protein
MKTVNKESQPASRAPLPLWLGEALAGCGWWAAVTAVLASSCCSWNIGDRSAASILTQTGGLTYSGKITRIANHRFSELLDAMVV